MFKQLVLLVSTVLSCAVTEFQSPYLPVAALFGPGNKFICNAVVLRRGQILTSANCLYRKSNGTYSLGSPAEFHVALETHTIERLQNGKVSTGKSSHWNYLEKLSQKFGAKFDNKYGNEVFSEKLKPGEAKYLNKMFQFGVMDSKPKSTNLVSVSNLRIHPQFKVQFENDLAVLEVSENWPVANASIAEVFNTFFQSAFNRSVTVYGFGVLSHGSNETNRPVFFKVRTVEMYLLPPSSCQQDLGDLFSVKHHLCLRPKGNETLCLGFTGAPIVLDRKLVGIVEFGRADCSLDSPIVGIRLNAYREFLGLPGPRRSFMDIVRQLMGNVEAVMQ